MSIKIYGRLNYFFLLVNLPVRWQKMALLVLRRVGLCLGQNQMCRLRVGIKLLACLIFLLAVLVNRFAYLN